MTSSTVFLAICSTSAIGLLLSSFDETGGVTDSSGVATGAAAASDLATSPLVAAAALSSVVPLVVGAASALGEAAASSVACAERKRTEKTKQSITIKIQLVHQGIETIFFSLS